MKIFKMATVLSLLLVLMTAWVTAAPPSEFPLHDAIRDGDLDRLTELLQTDQDPDEINKQGQTAMHFALQRHGDRGYLYVRELLNYGADPDATDSVGATTLRHAAGNGFTAIANLLLINGADVHARTDGGGSSLAAAYIHGYLDVARLLESYGARMGSEDHRRQLLAVGLVNAAVRECALKTQGESTDYRIIWITRALREKREAHGLHDLLSDDTIRNIARDEVSTIDVADTARGSEVTR